MKYRVIKPFTCKLDMKVRRVGDIYETDDPERAKFLQSKGYLGAMIEPPVKPEQKVPGQGPKHVGGGWYELPSGERVKGKEEAIAAMGGGD